jgi:hypothetical protein
VVVVVVPCVRIAEVVVLSKGLAVVDVSVSEALGDAVVAFCTNTKSLAAVVLGAGVVVVRSDVLLGMRIQ